MILHRWPGANGTKRRALFYFMSPYLVGVASMAIYLVWSSISGGGLERQHDTRHLLAIAFGLTLHSLFWPYVLIVVILLYLGVIHHPPHPIELRILG